MSNQPARKPLSKSARARIAAAQRKRWALWKSGKSKTASKHAKHASHNGKLGDLISIVDNAIKDSETKVANLKTVRSIIERLDRVVA